MRRRKERIVLIGLMGCGKTTVGIKLSYRLRIPVVDTDKLIETAQQQKISDIFATQGEEAFRQMETKLLRNLAEQPYKRILSVGGGTPVREENRPLLRQCGKVFYLRACADTLYERLKTDTTRPLLQCADPLARIRELLLARQGAYEECADVILDVDDLSPEDILDKIIAEMKKETI